MQETLTMHNFKTIAYSKEKSEHRRFLEIQLSECQRLYDDMVALDKINFAMVGLTSCCYLFGPAACAVLSSGELGFSLRERMTKFDKFQNKLSDLVEIYKWTLKSNDPTSDKMVQLIVKTIGPFIISKIDLFSELNLNQEDINQEFRKICDESTFLRFHKFNKYFSESQGSKRWIGILKEISSDDIKLLIKMFLYGNYENSELFQKKGPFTVLPPVTLSMMH